MVYMAKEVQIEGMQPMHSKCPFPNQILRILLLWGTCVAVNYISVELIRKAYNFRDGKKH